MRNEIGKPRYGTMFTPLRQKATKATRIYGLDIETTDNNRKFLCGSLWSFNPSETRFFRNREEMINYILTPKFHGCIIVATNLSFDYFALFHGSKRADNARLMWRGSDLLKATVSAWDGKAAKKMLSRRITFLDTMNYSRMSVSALGEMLGVGKLIAPKCLNFDNGKEVKYGSKLPELKPNREEFTATEWRQIEAYNLKDSEISARAMLFFRESFILMGAEPKPTIAMTAMGLFRTRFLTGSYAQPPVEVLQEQFNGYYGGRCEVFGRGHIENMNFYDVNSLYPSMMLNEYPDTNTMRTTKDDKSIIMAYDGMSDVSVFCPNMQYPLLPFRLDNKLLFPTGSFRGWYTHIELRRAVELGYKIIYVHKTYYYLRNCKPFKEYVEFMYNKRLEHAGTPLEGVCKMLLNSLGGKFGQRFDREDDIQPFSSMTYEMLQKLPWHQQTDDGNYIRLKHNSQPPAPFCIPMWAAYMTAYGRIRLHQLLIQTNAVYCDTDSIITTETLQTGNELGKLKLEMHIDSGVLVRPKLYMLKGVSGVVCKAKGIGTRISMEGFLQLITGTGISYYKFMKFRESFKRGRLPNEIIPYFKQLSAEDDKRAWPAGFVSDEFQAGQAVYLTDGARLGDLDKARAWHDKQAVKAQEKYIKSDLFDRASVGKDITDAEFIDNEKWFEVNG